MTSSEARKRGGQPKPAEERKRNNLTFRARDELRDQIKKSAEASGRSLSEEIEHRLELSLAQKDQIKYEWGEDVFRIASAMAASLSQIEDWTGYHWTEDEKSSELFKETTVELIRNYRDIVLKNRRAVPHGDMQAMSNGDLVQVFAALGGLAPPRPKRPPVELIISDED